MQADRLDNKKMFERFFLKIFLEIAHLSNE